MGRCVGGWVGRCVGERASGNSYGSRDLRFDIFDKMRAAYIIYVYIINASQHAGQRVRPAMIVIIITRILSRM